MAPSLTQNANARPALSAAAQQIITDRQQQLAKTAARTLTVRLALHYGSSPFVRVVDTGTQVRKGKNGQDKTYPYTIVVPRVPLTLSPERSELGQPQCEFPIGPLTPGETRFLEARGCGAAPVDERMGQGWGSGSPAFYEVGYDPETGKPFKRLLDPQEATLLGFSAGPEAGCFDRTADSAGVDVI